MFSCLLLESRFLLCLSKNPLALNSKQLYAVSFIGCTWEPPSSPSDWNGTKKMKAETIFSVLNILVGIVRSSDEENVVLSNCWLRSGLISEQLCCV